MKVEFHKVTGFTPYKYQQDCMNILAEGKSLILRAPTGAGKTEIPIIPFIYLRNEKLPTQLIYSLPTRVLVENVGKRIKKYASFKGLDTAIHHGRNVESSFFEEDVIVTTLDQTIGAYCCTPLSMPRKFGNICAGSVATAFLVFDEAHIYDPLRGLQSMLAVIHHSSKLGIPWVIMSATLPDEFILRIKRDLESKYGIDVETWPPAESNERLSETREEDFPSRRGRRVKLIQKLNELLTSSSVKEVIDNHNDKNKFLVVLNTVEKAQKLFLELKNLKDKNKVDEIVLLHSRFLDEDRKKKEEKLIKLMGKNSTNSKKVVFISTQVVEVGVDISADILLTELAPIDALIQRIGRVARWVKDGKREGVVYVFGVEKKDPYRETYLSEVMDGTEDILRREGELNVKWEEEVRLVNEVYKGYWECFLDQTIMFEVLGNLARAMYENNAGLIEQNVREILTCNVALHSNPEEIDREEDGCYLPFLLPQIRLNYYILLSKFKKLRLEMYKVEENEFVDGFEGKYKLKKVIDEKDILPFELYIVKPKNVEYNEDEGLVFEEGRIGKSFMFFPKDETLEEKVEKITKKKETWVEHAKRVVEVFDTIFLPKYDYAVTKFSEFFRIEKNELVTLIRLAIALHDIGKLDKYWQKRIGWDGKGEPLARNVIERRIGKPHAPIGYYALMYLFYEKIQDLAGNNNISRNLTFAILLSIANHHSGYIKNCPQYSFVDNWEKLLSELMIDQKYKNKIVASSPQYPLDKRFFDISKQSEDIVYRFYVFLSKLLRLSDWYSVGGGF